ncbi:PREDICTED: sigma factor binding protein 1, chloroplastic-like [Camelina sativa]|uniref:Sigma factor binding protein 1, chloroplastic-like n=1 Tax=Camelina sativa TaxID=90675 RepID=A0ABM0ZIP0_CAMSA|nr:PREDICTED: sigma factor binding protein 1, chloroplastic-like [Camelina sativa]
MESSSSTFLTTTSLEQRNPSLVSRKSPKHKKKTNKPIKVRYISNPMRVQTCASKFRELVQELTGQDAVDLQPESIYDSPSSSDHNPSPPPCAVSTPEDLTPRVLHHQELFDGRVGDCYEPLAGEEMFLPQLSAGFSGFFSNGFYNVNDFGSIDSM